jgi:hypothetical protein
MGHFTCMYMYSKKINNLIKKINISNIIHPKYLSTIQHNLPKMNILTLVRIYSYMYSVFSEHKGI